jgi:HPt (histidine-containing phosphotransfer) domain-containing protein
MESRLAEDLMKLLRAELPEHRHLLQMHCRARQWEAVYDQAHKLHGSAAYCKKSELANAAAALERASSAVNEQAIAQALETTLHEIERVLAADGRPA